MLWRSLCTTRAGSSAFIAGVLEWAFVDVGWICLTFRGFVIGFTILLRYLENNFQVLLVYLHHLRVVKIGGKE